MKKSFLSQGWKYTLILLLSAFLIFCGILLQKAYLTTPEEHFYLGTRCLESDPAKAVRHFKRAKESPLKSIQIRSQLYLAHLYHHGGQGVNQHIPTAVFYYEKLATEKIPEALYQLALFYDAGDKVPENREKAIDYMKQAAETLPEAQYALGVWMEREYLGKADMEKILTLYTQAANGGVINAIKSLISLYHGGEKGIKKNTEKETYWREQLKLRLKKK